MMKPFYKVKVGERIKFPGNQYTFTRVKEKYEVRNGVRWCWSLRGEDGGQTWPACCEVDSKTLVEVVTD